jgi:hypothetical protein
MAGSITVPVKTYKNGSWAELSSFGPSLQHQICGETVRLKDEKFSFLGGPRVRLYVFKKNVHWCIPDGVNLDIEKVKAAGPPRRQSPKKG